MKNILLLYGLTVPQEVMFYKKNYLNHNKGKIMMRGNFQNEQKFIYVLPTYTLFRQKIYVRHPDSQKKIFFAKYTPSFSFSSCTISNK